VEHPCPKCGASVEDGVPFCAACRAPQIRVIGYEPQTSTPLENQPAHEDLSFPSATVPADSGRIRWSQALPCAALGGALALLLALIPFAVFGPAFLVGGAVSVMLYRRRVKGALLTPGCGALIGAASGGFAFLFPAILMLAMLVHHAADLRKAMMESVSQMSSRGYDPQKVQQVIELLQKPEGLRFFVIFGLCLIFVIFIAGSSIGAAWYCAWLRRRT
jgi:hypothetical protein